jgi:hypothetical protein
LVEKRIGDKFLISYSYKYKGIIKTVKKLINKDSNLVSKVYLPSYAHKVYNNIIEASKASLPINTFSVSDSADMINSMIMILQDKYNVKVNMVTSKELGFTRAEVRNGELYINVDTASIEEPLHELLHMVLASMKASNYDNYVNLIQGVRKHPLFKEVSEVYNESNLDRLEETFIRLLTQTVRNEILIEGVFSEEIFDKAVKQGITNLLELRDDLTGEYLYDLFETNVSNILLDFGSSLLDSGESIFDRDNAIAMLKVSSVVRKLLEENNLKEYCNG